MNTDKELLNMCGKYILGDMLEIPFKVIFSSKILLEIKINIINKLIGAD